MRTRAGRDPQAEELCEERPRLAVKVLRKPAVLLSRRLRQTSGALAEGLGS